MKKAKMHAIASWVFALLTALIIANLVVLFYERPTGWIERSNGATAIHDPGSVLIHNTEGHGVYKADQMGYFNEGDLIDSGYILAVGSSHTAGKEVTYGNRFSDVLNSLLKEQYNAMDSNELLVYNVSQDGYYFPKIVKGFSALVHEFPDSRAIILEIGKTEYTDDEFVSAFPQIEYSEASNPFVLFENLSAYKKLSMTVKEYVPIANTLKSALKKVTPEENEDQTVDVPMDTDASSYMEHLTLCLQTMRNEYDKTLIILYHPTVEIKNNIMQVNVEETTPLFQELCSKYNIVFIDMTNSFENAYKEKYIVPYGFYNTTMGSGHLNQAGHKLIAEKLYQYFLSEENGGAQP